nr:hypothetical protein [Tanacetum cinerariifolium]
SSSSASDQGTAALEMPPSEDVPATAAPGAGQAKETAATDPPAASESRIRGRDGTDVNAPQSHCGGIMLILDPQGAPMVEKVLLPYSWVWPLLLCLKMLLQAVYRPEWGVTNGSLLDTPEACQDLVDHVAPPGYFFELLHMHNEEFLRQYNVNLARRVAIGSQLRLRFEYEAKLLRKSVAQVARQDKRIQTRELEIRNLEALLEVEANAKKAAEDRSAGLSQELENMRTQFSGLQVSNKRLSQQVATLQQQVSGEETLK